MQIELTPQENYTLARIDGVIDDTAEETFRATLHPLFRGQRVDLILDLSGAPRINSRGIGNLVVLVSDANTNGSRVILAGATPFVANVLRVTKLNSFFQVAETVAAAETMLQS